MSKPFKAPRKVDAKEISISDDTSDSVSTTEEFSMEEDDWGEKVFREECKSWLALNGKALFALEVSRFLAKERKNSTPTKPSVPRTGGTQFFGE